MLEASVQMTCLKRYYELVGFCMPASFNIHVLVYLNRQLIMWNASALTKRD